MESDKKVLCAQWHGDLISEVGFIYRARDRDMLDDAEQIDPFKMDDKARCTSKGRDA